jgi:Na+/H+-translocating membrane pyrophosphatase
MVATALKEILFPLIILNILMFVLIVFFLIKKDLGELGRTIVGSLISGLIIALCMGLAKMDWNLVWNLFRKV